MRTPSSRGNIRALGGNNSHRFLCIDSNYYSISLTFRCRVLSSIRVRAGRAVAVLPDGKRRLTMVVIGGGRGTRRVRAKLDAKQVT